MKRNAIQPIIDEAKSRRAETPTNGAVIQCALEAHQALTSPRRPHPLVLSLCLVGATAGCLGLWVMRSHTLSSLPVAPMQSRVNKLESVNKKSKSPATKSHFAIKKSRFAVNKTESPAQKSELIANKSALRNAKSHSLSNESRPFSDDLDFINNGGSEAAIQHWAQLPQDEQVAQLERIKAIVKGGDDFIDIPLPMVATTVTKATAEALANYETERQIVDGRLAQGVTLGAKALSFAELCAELTRKTGVTFTAAPSVADDKITVFCTKRPVRELMREITNLFGFTWNRSGQPDEYSYRLTQPVKAQLAEQELRNKNKNIVYLGTLVTSIKEGAGKDTPLELKTLQGEYKILLDSSVLLGERKEARSQELPLIIQREQKGAIFEIDSSAATSGFAGLQRIEFNAIASTHNAERNKALKTLPEFARKVTFAPVPGEREPLLPGEGAPEGHLTVRTGEKDQEPLVTTADLLEAIHKATGKDLLGDSFTRLLPAPYVTAKSLPLFDALNTVCNPFHLQWSQERGWFQLRSMSFYSDRPAEIPNRFLQRWATNRRIKRGLDVSDLAEIATLRDEQLDSGHTSQGARWIQNLREWHLATSETLRPHWRFFSSLTPEQQKSALSAEGLGFRDLRQAQQWELLKLAFEKKDNVASVATQLSTIRLCVEKTRIIYHYTRPDGTPSEVVFASPR